MIALVLGEGGGGGKTLVELLGKAAATAQGEGGSMGCGRKVSCFASFTVKEPTWPAPLVEKVLASILRRSWELSPRYPT